MQCVFGLGNPGKEYEKTRHNVGFRVVEEIARELMAPPLQYQAKFSAELSRSGDILLIRPQTFMNDSGQAVRAVLEYYKIEPTHIFVVHDDLDIVLGAYKIQLGTGPHIHNGLNSIYQHLHTKNFWHVRVGVDNRGGDRSTTGQEYVLGSFYGEELQIIEEVIKNVAHDVILKLRAE